MLYEVYVPTLCSTSLRYATALTTSSAEGGYTGAGGRYTSGSFGGAGRVIGVVLGCVDEVGFVVMVDRCGNRLYITYRTLAYILISSNMTSCSLTPCHPFQRLHSQAIGDQLCKPCQNAPMRHGSGARLSVTFGMPVPPAARSVRQRARRSLSFPGQQRRHKGGGGARSRKSSSAPWRRLSGRCKGSTRWSGAQCRCIIRHADEALNVDQWTCLRAFSGVSPKFPLYYCSAVRQNRARSNSVGMMLQKQIQRVAYAQNPLQRRWY
jgi:hypothetical protein